MLILVTGCTNYREEKKPDVFCLSLKNLYPCFKKNIKTEGAESNHGNKKTQLQALNTSKKT